MKSKLSEKSDELDELYDKLKSAADDNDVGWHEFSQQVQQFTRLLFRYKRMQDRVTTDNTEE